MQPLVKRTSSSTVPSPRVKDYNRTGLCSTAALVCLKMKNKFSTDCPVGGAEAFLCIFLRGEGTILMISDFRLKYLPAVISAADQGHRHSAAPNTGIPISHYQPWLCTSIALLSKTSQEERIHYPSLSQHLSQTLAALLPHRPPPAEIDKLEANDEGLTFTAPTRLQNTTQRKEMAGPFLIILSPLLL